jgi:hypothetical protein
VAFYAGHSIAALFSIFVLCRLVFHSCSSFSIQCRIFHACALASILVCCVSNLLLLCIIGVLIYLSSTASLLSVFSMPNITCCSVVTSSSLPSILLPLSCQQQWGPEINFFYSSDLALTYMSDSDPSPDTDPNSDSTCLLSHITCPTSPLFVLTEICFRSI